MSDPDDDMLEEEQLFYWLNPVARISQQAEIEQEMFGCADKSTCWEGIETIREESIKDQVDESLSPAVLDELLKNPNGW